LLFATIVLDAYLLYTFFSKTTVHSYQTVDTPQPVSGSVRLQ
jgi:hypothetical protein